MATVSSNIDIYPISQINKPINNQIADKVLQKSSSFIDIQNYSDSFENNDQTKVYAENNDNYSNKIDPKFKFNNKSTQNNSEQLTPEEKKEVEKLQKTDQKVRAHEQAHLAAGAGLVRGGASFEYTRGPDGKMYAVGGEVKIDISPVNGKPDETIRKMQKVISAALAPVDPSPQDRAVANLARNLITKAQMEKNQESNKTNKPDNQQPNQNSQPINSNIYEQYNRSTTYNKNENQRKVIKQYIISNPYQNLDRIIFRSI